MKRHLENPSDIVNRFLKQLGDPTPIADQTNPVAARVLDRLRPEAATAGWTATPSGSENRSRSSQGQWKQFKRVAFAAAAVALTAMVIGIFIRMANLPNADAIAESADGLFRGLGNSSSAIHAGDRIRSGETVHADGDGAVLELADGSRIEMRTQATLALEPARDGVRIRLAAGSVIVTAAKQGQGHLYVETRDCTISVVGTVFLVHAGEAGSRVAVIQGEVRVTQSGRENTVLPGQQVTTNPLMPSSPVAEEIAWSRNASALMAMLESIAGLIAPQAIAPASAQAEVGVIQGTVSRIGTGEPISEVQVSLSGGPMSPKAVQALIEYFQARGVTLSLPAAGQSEDKYLQYVSDTAAARGVSVGNPETRTMLDRFRTDNENQVTALSDATGHFTLKDVAPGQYVVHAQREGFFGNSVNGTNPPAASANATVSARQTVNVALALFSGGTISGQILDENGKPQPNTDVQAFSITYQNGYPVLQSVISKTTDDRGVYRLFWFPAGEYFIAVVPRQNSAPARPDTTDSTPRPQSMTTFYPGTPDITSATALAIRGGEQLEGISIPIRTAVPAKITGRITTTIPIPPPAPRNNAGGAPAPAQEPTQGAAIMLLQRDTSTPDNTGVTSNSGVRVIGSATLKSSTGQFEIDGILPGSYDVYARMGESNPDGGAGLTFGHAAVDVHGQDVSGVEIYVHPSVRVKGMVTFDPGIPAQTMVRISLQADGSAAKIPVYQAITRRAVVAANDGSFTVPAVTAGHFRIDAAAGLAPTLYVADVRQGGASIYDTGFDVGAEPPNPIEVIIRSGAGSIEGVVHDATGKPVSGATVATVPAESRRKNRALYGTAVTGPDGKFSIRGIAPGIYKIFAWENVPAGAFYNENFLSRYESRGHTIDVTQSSIATLDLVPLPAAGR